MEEEIKNPSSEKLGNQKQTQVELKFYISKLDDIPQFIEAMDPLEAIDQKLKQLKKDLVYYGHYQGQRTLENLSQAKTEMEDSLRLFNEQMYNILAIIESFMIEKAKPPKEENK